MTSPVDDLVMLELQLGGREEEAPEERFRHEVVQRRQQDDQKREEQNLKPNVSNFPCH
jgi:hypothetical protein